MQQQELNEQIGEEGLKRDIPVTRQHRRFDLKVACRQAHSGAHQHGQKRGKWGEGSLPNNLGHQLALQPLLQGRVGGPPWVRNHLPPLGFPRPVAAAPLGPRVAARQGGRHVKRCLGRCRRRRGIEWWCRTAALCTARNWRQGLADRHDCNWRSTATVAPTC